MQIQFSLHSDALIYIGALSAGRFELRFTGLCGILMPKEIGSVTFSMG